MSSPILESRLRGVKWLLLLLAGAVPFLLFLEYKLASAQPDQIVAEKEWLYVATDDVLFYMVKEGECQTERKYALIRVHEGLKVQVLTRQGELVEIKTENQNRLFTHGCIHESLLEKRK